MLIRLRTGDAGQSRRSLWVLRHLLDLSLEAAARAIGREILVATEATPPGCSARDWVREIARRFLGGEPGFLA